MRNQVVRLLASGLLAVAGGWGPAFAEAQYPTRPITVVVPYTAGGISDLSTRAVVRKLGERLEQNVIVENRPGAGGALGAEVVARARPDGYTLLSGALATQVTTPAMTATRYDPVADFVPIGTIVGTAAILLVGSSKPYRTVADLIDYARANPGKINIGSPGGGSTSHLTAELLQMVTKTRMVHVPYRGSSPAYIDLASGAIDVMFDYPAGAQALIDNGQLRALAVTDSKRLPGLQNVPTMAEAGIQGVDSMAWGALMAPRGTPDDVVALLTREMAAVMADPDITMALRKMGAIPLAIHGADLARFIANETVKWRSVIEHAGIKIE